MASGLPTNAITPAEYLERERKAIDKKSEYFQGEIFAMTGGTFEHSLIKANFVREAGVRVEDKPCLVLGCDLRVKVNATGLYTYPDATIVCGEPEFDDDQKDTLVNPTVLVEVLSPSTENYDRGKKACYFRQIESLKEYILIAQDRPHVERFVRQASGGCCCWTKIDSMDRSP